MRQAGDNAMHQDRIWAIIHRLVLRDTQTDCWILREETVLQNV